MADVEHFNEIHILKDSGYFGVFPPVMTIIRGVDAQASVNFTTSFFVADRSCEVVRVKERHEVAAGDGSLDVRKTPSGTSAASSTSILSGNMNLTTVADTNQTATLSGTTGNTRLAPGDALTMVANGTLVNLQGVTVQVIVKTI